MKQFPNIVNSLYEYFENKDKEREPRKGISFSPSSLNDCGRKVFYRLTEEEASNPIDLPARFKMHFGTVQHRGLQDIFVDLGIHMEGEVKKEIEFQGLEFHYLIDEIASIDGEKYIIEIKTTYAKGFDFIKEQPKEDHVMQTLAYMQFEKIQNAIILYVGRDNGYMIQYNLHWNDHLWVNNQVQDHFIHRFKEQIQKMQNVKKMIDAGELPVRDYKMMLKNMGDHLNDNFTKDKVKYKTDWQCGYCMWKDKCWKEVLDEAKNHQFYINGEFID